MKVVAVFLSAFVAASLGMPTEHVLHEKRAATYTKRASLASNEMVPVRIALKQSNINKGMDLLMDVSDPSSSNYGNHYTPEQVKDLFAPSDDSAEAVKRWLVNAGIPAESITSPKSQGWLDFKTTVSGLESLLKTQYHVYETRSGEHFGTDKYHLPANVANHVDFIQPAVAMSQIKRSTSEHNPSMLAHKHPRPIPKNTKDASGCDTTITPECIRALYNIPEATSKIAGNEMGFFESQGEYVPQSDLDQFFSTYASNIPQGTGPKQNFIDYNGQNPDGSQQEGEAALDFDVAWPVIYPQGTVLFQANSNFDGNSHLGFINQFLDAIDGSYCTSGGGDDPKVDGTTNNESCGDFKPTNVISVSYGLTENDWPAAYLKRQCNEFMKLGLQGTSIVFASGDGGVAGGHGGNCVGTNSDIFNPATPGDCPYVTSVGATYLPKGSKIGDPEVATASFASGGGFSNIWTTADYQKDAVASFFANHDPGYKTYNTSDGTIPTTGGIYNRAGRGFPDVAAVGDNGAYVVGGQAGLNGGTSMSAPVFASILNRLNEERLAAGKKVIGFANPALYKNPSMFNQITSGDQSANGQCNGKGFTAVPGWNPVTGLGTPKYPEMSKYFNSL
ncbi:hypothetical protein NLG97_g838 [Lecanicillium saksenae]|uniref:Uncharacterized protein n=1 Tax=Lecanicillium saksenae TaxID=468837 RepID=A0ACC1R852_9HYPO|nr:hypothetical protein NLG97_g838 [Lecanicillium saksenae]